MVIADAGDDFQLAAQDVHREILLGEEAELVHEQHVAESAFALGGEVGVDRAARRSLRIEDLAFAQVARGAVLAADDQPVVSASQVAGEIGRQLREGVELLAVQVVYGRIVRRQAPGFAVLVGIGDVRDFRTVGQVNILSGHARKNGSVGFRGGVGPVGVGGELLPVRFFVRIVRRDGVFEVFEPVFVEIERPVGVEAQAQVALGHQVQIPRVVGIRFGLVLGVEQVERGVGGPFADGVRVAYASRHTVVGVVSFGRIVLGEGVVYAVVEHAGFTAEAHAVRYGSHVDIGIDIQLDRQRRASRLAVDDDGARSDVAVLGRGNTPDHLYRFDVVGGDGSHVDARVGGRYAGPCVGSQRQRQGLHVGVVRKGSAVHDDGRAEALAVADGECADFLEGDLFGRACAGARKERHDVGQRCGLNVLHGRFGNLRSGCRTGLFRLGRHHDVFQIERGGL